MLEFSSVLDVPVLFAYCISCDGTFIFMLPCMLAVHGCGLLFRFSRVSVSVCGHIHELCWLRRWLNRFRCHLGVDSRGPKKHYSIWQPSIWTGPRLPQQKVNLGDYPSPLQSIGNFRHVSIFPILFNSWHQQCGLLLSLLWLLWPSVLWRCWLGGGKGIRPVKNWVVRC